MNILLVDDDPEVIAAFVPLLSKVLPGESIHGATDGREAFAAADKLGHIDVLVTDVVMGEVDGFSLRDLLLKRFPKMRTVFVSGYDMSEYADRIGTDPVFQKPVDWNALGEAILGNNETAPTRKATPQAASEREPARNSQPSAVADPLIGHRLAGYEFVRQLGEGRRGPVYEAIQLTMQRPVAIKVLTHELQTDQSAKQQFMTDAGAKAAVRHPLILAVYEAGEADGWCFYSREYVNGENLAELAARGGQLDELMTVRVISGVARAMSSFYQHQIPHGQISARRIYIGTDMRARLSNIAIAADSEPPNAQREILTLANVMRTVLPARDTLLPELHKMLARMRVQDSTGFQSWGALLQEIKVIEPKVVAKAFRPNPEIEAQIRAFAATHQKRKFKTMMRITGIAAAVLLIVAVFVVWWMWFRPK